jgi:hypothetical protein
VREALPGGLVHCRVIVIERHWRQVRIASA